MHSRMKKGITFISILVSLFILLVGIITLFRVFPVINKLSVRAKRSVSVSMIADKIFVLMEKAYESKSGTEIPIFLEGIDDEFPQYSYRINFTEEKEDLYKMELEISYKKEGKIEKGSFYQVFRRR